MGVVYLGEGRGGTKVAVKAIRADLDGWPTCATVRARGRRGPPGGRMAPRRKLDLSLDDDPPWVASEFVDGPTLQEVVVKRGPLPASSLEGLASGWPGRWPRSTPPGSSTAT